MPSTLVILAAGAGSRFGGLKQLAPIGPQGEALLEYTAFDALRAGFSRIVVVVRPETETIFRDYLEPGLGRRTELIYVHQTLKNTLSDLVCPSDRRRPWGTAHAVLSASSEIERPFAAVNADDFYGAESYRQLADFLEQPGPSSELEMALIGFPVAETLTEAGPVTRARCQVDAEGLLEEIHEIKKVWRRGDEIVYCKGGGKTGSLDGEEIVSMNMWGFSPALFGELRERFRSFVVDHGSEADSEFLLPDVVRDLLAEGRARVRVLPGSSRWCGITFREDQARVRTLLDDLIDQGEYPRELWT